MTNDELEIAIIKVLTEKGALDQMPLHCEIFGWADWENGRTGDVINLERPQTEAVLEDMFKRRLLDRKITKYGRRASVARISDGQIVYNHTYSIANPKQKRALLTDEQKAAKATAKANIYRDLPKIVVVLGVTDYGPCDGGASAVCPHCGAEGRYVYTFRCVDGSTRGAMKGCLSKYPRHIFASESQRLLDKEADYKKQGWNLPSWDVEIKDAIFAFADGSISESDAMSRVRTAQETRRRYRERRRRAA